MESTVPIAGYFVPVHRAVTEQILMGGVPRAIAITNGTLAAAIGLGLQLWVAGLVIFVLGHSVALWATRRDAQFVDVARRHLRYPGYLRV
ncbi:VirB3 family type IV secretion system protein [Pelagibacterium sp. 26DY04]|uniref:VirB3 family type IV secretion system protein n=1 Tax=Pelagibacterium sp. 26DY04 TaxID=2967130 RepID=UPI0028169A06|nr:VirB3 family type IV secretion system protein [Pelagibacterium sp. 26DY04]WMT86447.1 VirB3 family type IV secretion system protein [Pelagibacterium sp. 26DY04]